MTQSSLLDTLVAFLRIPSVSSGGGDPAALQAGAAFVADLIERGGGRAEVRATARNPLVVGELGASRPDAPTVIAYGHGVGAYTRSVNPVPRGGECNAMTAATRIPSSLTHHEVPVRVAS